MSKSSIERLLLAGGISIALALGGCASAPPPSPVEPVAPVIPAIKPVREQPETPAAAESQTTHVTVVPVPTAPDTQATVQKVIEQYADAINLLKDGKQDEALLILKAISAEIPTLSGPLVNQGVIFVHKEQWDDALAVLDEAIKANERNPYAWNLKGLVLRQKGKFADARAAYEQALALDPMYAKAHFNLGVLADLYLQDLAVAIRHYEKYQALQTKPDQAVGNWITDLRNRLNAAQPVENPAPPPPAGAVPATSG